MKKLEQKISIMGCGNVGMAYAYAGIIKAIAREYILVDIDKERIERRSNCFKPYSTVYEDY